MLYLALEAMFDLSGVVNPVGARSTAYYPNAFKVCMYMYSNFRHAPKLKFMNVSKVFTDADCYHEPQTSGFLRYDIDCCDTI